MSKRTKVTFSLILVICLLLTGLPSAAPVSAAEVDEVPTSPITESTATEPQAVTEQAAVTEETPVLQLDADCQILNHVDPEVFAAGNHIARLPEQETLSSYVFLNADGSQTVYYMDQPVKFEKADGTVVEKNLTLTAATEGYTTTRNDIQLTIPTNPTNGIRLIYDNHQITLIPQGGTLTNAAQATDNSVTYPDYYGEGMSLRYTPTLSGVKEDILLDAYYGVNSFTFRLNTGGLNLYQANGRYYLAESKVATDRIELGQVVSYDAKSKFSIGTMTAQTIMAGQAYMLTLTVDEAFLTDENTTYPVTIDPTLTISYGNNGDNYIIDAPIFEGYPNNNYGAFQYNRVGYVDSSYQSGRTVVKLPVLTSSSTYTSLTADNITSVKFYVKEATGSSGISVSLYPLTSNSTWTETNVTWNNVGSRASTATDTKTLTDSAWSAFDITALVKQWKNGTYSANCGFIMIGASENSTDKSFCSSEHEKTSYRPYVVMTYTSDISLNKTTADVDKGSTLTLTATTSPAGETVTWSSSNTSVATVSSGKVTGVALGSATITATKADGTSASCLVYVTIADGVYRIQNGNNGLYLGTYGSIAENTSVKLLGYSNTGLSMVRQLWKISYIGGDNYSIRPMHKLDMGLHATSNNVDITTTSGPNNTLNDVVSYHRWGISSTGTEGVYYINNVGTSSMAMRAANGAASPGLGVITAVNNGSSGTFRWILEPIDNPPSGAILYNIQSQNAYSSPPTIDTFINTPQTLPDHNMLAVAYAGLNNYTIKWHSDKPEVVSVNSDTGVFTGNTAGSATITGEISLGDSSQKAVFYVRVKQAFSGGGEFHNGTDVIAAANSWAQCGYDSWYTISPVMATLNESNLNSDIVYFSTHGDQHLIQFENDMTLTDSTIAETSTSSSIEEMSINNSVLYIYDACLTASDLDGSGKNLCTSTIDAGAECVIGWTESIFDSDALAWQQRFQAKLCEGSTVINAANYANTFIYNDNESIKSWRIYGDQTIFITATSATMASSITAENYIDVASSAEAGIVYSENTSMQLLQKYFGQSNLTNTDTFVPTKTYTTDDNNNYVVDLVMYRGSYALGIGYTIIVENHKIVGIRNNMGSYIAADLNQSAMVVTDIDTIRVQAHEDALNHMANLSPDYSVIEQSDDLYFDCDTSTHYCRVYTEYLTPTGAHGAFITLYPINNGGNEYET